MRSETELDDDHSLSFLTPDPSAEEFFRSLSRALPSPLLDQELRNGQRVGHYDIRERIGAGGMGTVYCAHDTRLDREVALKFLPAHLSVLPEARERLLVEARAAAALEHPNVCTVHEIGETEDGQLFIVMSLCKGETLKARLDREGPLPVAEAERITAQIASALAAVHRRGIVHRDVKPGNVMLGADGTAKLLDFGLAHPVDASPARPGSMAGTIAYMSPEQVKGDPADPRADLWSLGVLLYETLVGARPFRGGSGQALLQAILHEEPEPVVMGRHETPQALLTIVERLLRKDPAKRYGTADELLADLTADPPPVGPPRPPTGARPVRRWITLPRIRTVTTCRGAVLWGALLMLPSRALAQDAVEPSVWQFAIRNVNWEEVDRLQEQIRDYRTAGAIGSFEVRIRTDEMGLDAMVTAEIVNAVKLADLRSLERPEPGGGSRYKDPVAQDDHSVFCRGSTRRPPRVCGDP